MWKRMIASFYKLINYIIHIKKIDTSSAEEQLTSDMIKFIQ